MESKSSSATPSIATIRPSRITRPGSGSWGERIATSPRSASSTANPSRLTRWASMNLTLPTGRPAAALASAVMPRLPPLSRCRLGPQLDHLPLAPRRPRHAAFARGAHHDPGPIAAEQVVGKLDRLILAVGGGARDGQQRGTGRHLEDHRLVGGRADHLDV